MLEYFFLDQGLCNSSNLVLLAFKDSIMRTPSAVIWSVTKYVAGYKFDDRKPDSPVLKIHFAHFPFCLPSAQDDQRFGSVQESWRDSTMLTGHIGGMCSTGECSSLCTELRVYRTDPIQVKSRKSFSSLCSYSQPLREYEISSCLLLTIMIIVLEISGQLHHPLS